MRGCGRNFGIVDREDGITNLRLGGDNPIGEGVVRGAAMGFVPAGREFIAEAQRQS